MDFTVRQVGYPGQVKIFRAKSEKIQITKVV